MSDSKGDYETRSPKCHEKFDTTIYLHIKKKSLLRGPIKMVGITVKSLLCSTLLYERL